MAKQRVINTYIWDDPFIHRLDQDEKLLWIYALTNSHTDLCGAYEITMEKIEFQTKIAQERILEIFAKFEAAQKIIYRDGWVMIKNFAKHQQGNSPNVRKGIARSLNDCPDWVKQTLSRGFKGLQGASIENALLLLPVGTTSTSTEPSEAAKTPPEARGGEGRGIASIPVNPEVDESLDAFLSKVRRIYDVNVLPNEQRWVTTVIQADEAGITPDQFAFALSTLLSDKSRRFPVTPQNALDAALNERAKKAKPLTDGKPIFTH